MRGAIGVYEVIALCCTFVFCSLSTGSADDWPEWRGKHRRGIWMETGILDAFPKEGLDVSWRTPIGSGYAGPSVSRGRVFVTDFIADRNNKGTERILCLDEKTGEVIWTYSWDVDYTGLQLVYAIGPRATPTVAGEQVFVLGAMGNLKVLEVETGALLWEKEFVRDFGASVPVWGISSAPIVEGSLVITFAAGEPDAKVMAFDRETGDEVWRALSSDWEPGYSQPIIFDYAGKRQLIVWHPRAITSLDPLSGELFWQEPYVVSMGMTVSTPIQKGPYLFVSSFYDGARMLRLDEQTSEPTTIWQSSGQSEVRTDRIHTLINTAVIQGDYLYGIDSYGQMRCLELSSGKRIWENLDVTKEKQRWTAAFFVRNGDRFFVNNDRGELILAKFSPSGFEELSRTQLIEPTSATVRRREFNAVHWSHPAYANRHILVRNDKEILRASLARSQE